MPKIVIVQRILPHYRVPFFEQLYLALMSEGIQFLLVYGQEKEDTVPRSVSCDRPWAIRVENRYFYIAGAEIVWQPALKHAFDADLVIVEHASRLVLNMVLLARRKFRKFKLAFWGHGTNLQNRNGSSAAHALSRWSINKADWWFAYTEMSRSLITQQGYPAKNITTVNNSIDSSELIHARTRITSSELDTLKSSLSVDGSNVAIYCGGMYRHKRLDFLLAACDRVKSVVPDFHVIMIGDGPDREIAREAARSRPWVHLVGAKFGKERVPYFLISKLMLMPGLVGLAVIDSFALGTPLITTDNDLHSPEIVYLQNGINGVISGDSIEDFSRSVCKVLQQESLHQELVAGCDTAARKYNIEVMAERFAKGIKDALGMSHDKGLQ